MRDDGGQDQWKKVNSFQPHFQIRGENGQDLLIEGHQANRMRGKKLSRRIPEFLCGVTGWMYEGVINEIRKIQSRGYRIKCPFLDTH